LKYTKLFKLLFWTEYQSRLGLNDVFLDFLIKIEYKTKFVKNLEKNVLGFRYFGFKNGIFIENAILN